MGLTSARAWARSSTAAWPILAAPTALVLLVCVVDLGAGSWAAMLFETSRVGLRDLGLAAFLAVVALGFEEVVTRAARLQLRLSSDLKRDMTSVWAVAAAVALSRAAAVLLLVAIFTYVWFRQQRPAGEVLFRKVFNLANVILSCLVAAEAVRLVHPWAHDVASSVGGSVEVACAILAYAVVNRVITTCALAALALRGKALLGSRDNNLIEFATLCLGGLVALAVLFQPLLAVLALAPMVTLQRGAAMRALESAATTDAKTGLLNAVAWEEVATRELARAARIGADIAVLIIDIDHFKRVNDRYGHLAGDRMLRLIGKTLAAEVRDYDTVARFGGEEFVAVLPSASTVDALVIAERLRSRVHELRMSSAVSGLDRALDQTVAISIGVAVAPTDGVELPDLLHAADAALYRAKAEGRNRVALADRRGPGSQEMLLFG